MNSIIKKFGVVTSAFQEYSIEEALKVISESGFKYIEFCPDPCKEKEIKNTEAQRILNLCKAFGLKFYCISAHGNFGNENTIINLKKIMDFASLCGVNFITTDVGEVKTLKEERKFYSDIEILADYAKLKNITICLETHGNWLNSGKIGATIIKKINHPNIKLNYDTGNVMYYGGIKAEEDIKYAVPYMGFIHLKERTDKPKEFNFSALGKGKLDFEKIFNLIKDYSGYISVEVEFDGKIHPLDEISNALKESYHFLRVNGYMQ